MKIVNGLQFYYKRKPETIFTISDVNKLSGRCVINWDSLIHGPNNSSSYNIKDVESYIEKKSWIVTHIPKTSIKLYRRILL